MVGGCIVVESKFKKSVFGMLSRLVWSSKVCVYETVSFFLYFFVVLYN